MDIQDNFMPWRDEELIAWGHEHLGYAVTIRHYSGCWEEELAPIWEALNRFEQRYRDERVAAAGDLIARRRKAAARREFEHQVWENYADFFLGNERLDDECLEKLRVVTPPEDVFLRDSGAPVSSAEPIGRCRVRLHIRSQRGPRRRDWPGNVHCARVRYVVGHTVAVALLYLTTEETTTRTWLDLRFPRAWEGMICSYVVGWEDDRGDFVGWSEIRWFRVP
jgi:hypothetical protein